MATNKKIDAEELFAGIREGKLSALSRGITLIESVLPAHRSEADKLVALCLPFSGQSFRLGITGVPGVGKSSFIERFGLMLSEKGKKLAVLAVDPSSEISHGSILGDKTRMEQLALRKDVFIRPSPSGGHLGGVARRTREAIILCEAASYDFIIVETVGVGQSETAVYHLTDFFLLLMLAGAGDELQGIKRGIMEMADALVITKADGGNEHKAKSASIEYARAMHFLPPQPGGWIPEVETCSSLTGQGMEAIYAILEKFQRHQDIKGLGEQRRKNQNLYWFNKSLQEGLLTAFMSKPAVVTAFEKLKLEVLEGKISPEAAVLSLTAKFYTAY